MDSVLSAGRSPAKEIQQPADDTEPESTQDEGPQGGGGLSGGLCGLRIVVTRPGLGLSRRGFGALVVVSGLVIRVEGIEVLIALGHRGLLLGGLIVGLERVELITRGHRRRHVTGFFTSFERVELVAGGHSVAAIVLRRGLRVRVERVELVAGGDQPVFKVHVGRVVREVALLFLNRLGVFAALIGLVVLLDGLVNIVLVFLRQEGRDGARVGLSIRIDSLCGVLPHLGRLITRGWTKIQVIVFTDYRIIIAGGTLVTGLAGF